MANGYFYQLGLTIIKEIIFSNFNKISINIKMDPITIGLSSLAITGIATLTSYGYNYYYGEENVKIPEELREEIENFSREKQLKHVEIEEKNNNLEKESPTEKLRELIKEKIQKKFQKNKRIFH